MEHYDNLIDDIKSLKNQGYVEDFNLKQTCLECRKSEYKVFHNEFSIDKSVRFEANSDPEEESIIYAISSDKYQVKGILVNGYWTSSNTMTNEMLERLK